MARVVMALPSENLVATVEAFCQAATTHAEATNSGEYKTANRAYANLVAALKCLEAHESTHLLRPLLHSAMIGPKLWSATYFLSRGETKAVDILNQLATRKDILGFSAQMTLREWQAGRLTFHFPA
ncbi:hypothetical protein [Hymenobacter weizhouensis]|uniref:hypothetical protein n=1 Tax=Hymenobacter sp. YIM 151500-1 TaxID=2987689 RepID=UPI002225BCE4|nr:hypothetical protein [Hymenobacter sp. YIM 151500-1]UYZ64501.1 hypothetical protein OIS53_06530 [Hymenobacter sp. YIM 151500-1]